MEKTKNCWLIPTDKPSRLYLGDNENLILGLMKNSIENKNNDFTNQNIYITNSEEIKFNDYITDGYKVWQWKDDSSLLGRKKIILTTDIDLIKDGIQAIDDEFLEWFVKNPNCEKVKIEEGVIKHIAWSKELESKYDFEKGYPVTGYKIIIPSEEPKPHSFCETPEEKCTMNYCDENGCQNRNRVLVEELKQETLEEAAERVYTTELVMDVDISGDLQYAFIAGAKWQQEQYKIDIDDAYNEGFENGKHWQQERSYSEEEVKQAYTEGGFAQLRYIDGLPYIDRDKWFEQYKK